MKYLYGLKQLQWLFRKLYYLSLKGMNFNIVGSGEDYVLKIVSEKKNHKELVIFDVGANVGQYASLVYKTLSSRSLIHCFEPSSQSFKMLQNNVGDFENVRLNSFGLGSASEEITFYGDDETSTFASAYQQGNLSTAIEKVQIETLDAYLEQNKISEIDLLKIDVEGYDLNVLKGAKKSIDSGIIEHIQFEFGGTQIAPRVFIKDFWDLLSPSFDIYRVLKNGLSEIRTYSDSLEIFAYSNYLAIRKSSE
ncbi:FkbM family methyltransferase [Jiulongibacter sp. NS-SX5]|uniref:FkbM family methyltransferase n=1 Tax=Jiulongibacter sp. NS-SX5 TaxID=3463854 RepID=UPI0040581EB0